MEDGIKTLKRENNKIVQEGIKKIEEGKNEIVGEEEGNKNEKGEGQVKHCAQYKKGLLAFFDYFNRIFNIIFLQLF